jgi:hypothetical protein
MSCGALVKITFNRFSPLSKNFPENLILFLLFSFLKALPKLPVPPLEQTMSEYLRAVQPIVSSQQFEKTERIVKQLITNPGPQLYQYLLDKREAEDNWVRSLMYII